ncbi:spinster family MFS transporter [Alteriqipengyuania lutimaris]|uniref:MFS transporter n=1 Tax=Alteriqipengyuania lutimaris TaxID=1538146 RepID=A0A395LSB9_9SPHN|nr:MFS transporter [Alteriqipengyuania lutimaris]MBB3032522.1 MFS family permease [Alteriqipengyuania lutimaris]RDS78344.1 MFS transporter [Alteriqipengyuania lutimaris]
MSTTETTAQAEAPPAQTPYSKASYRYFVLGVLTLVYALNFVDRQLLVILQEQIKEELVLSDTQLGLLSGLAFAVFYVSCGIPIARWADSGNRRNIIALALTVWSGMTAVSGLAQNYAQLVLARVGVGVGEAGGSPPAHSMISDIFPEKERATALSIYSIGIYIGILTGFALGGFIADAFGWRMAFFVVGLPGVIVALFLRFAVAEPIRGWSEKRETEVGDNPGVIEVLKFLWSRKTFRNLALAGSLQAMIIYAIGNWLPSYFLRYHEIGLAQLGVWMALTAGFGGGAGSFFGGWLADRMGQRDRRWYVWGSAIMILAITPVLLVMLTTGNLTLALLLTGVFHFLSASYLGPALAVSHGLVGLRMRALTSAVFFFFINLIGLGLGPFFVGSLSDGFSAAGYEAALPTAMLIVGCIASVWGCVHYLIASRHLREDIANSPATAPRVEAL